MSNSTLRCEVVIPPHLRTDSAKAIEKTQVLAFNGQGLIDLPKTDFQTGCIIYQGVARVVASRLQSAFMQLLGVCSQDYPVKQVQLPLRITAHRTAEELVLPT